MVSYKSYQSQMLAQIRGSIKDIEKLSTSITFEEFQKSLPMETAKRINTILLIGSGDCLCAGQAVKEWFEHYGINTEALGSLEFSRYYNIYRGFDPARQNVAEHAVVGLSVSGSAKRLSEAMQRMNELGGVSIAFTGKPESPMGKLAQFVIPVKIPSYGLAPNVASYTSIIYTLFMFAIYMALAKEKITLTQAQMQKDALLEDLPAWIDAIDEIEENSYELASHWVEDKVEMVEFLSDGTAFASAAFGADKLIEATGVLANVDDCENWCHVGHFVKNLSQTGCFFIAHSNSPSFSRELETIKVANSLREHVTVVTDAEPEQFPKTIRVIRIPCCSNLSVAGLFNHIPADFMAAYWGLLTGQQPFRIDSPIHQKDAPGTRYLDTQIVIIKEV